MPSACSEGVVDLTPVRAAGHCPANKRATSTSSTRRQDDAGQPVQVPGHEYLP